jgi:O-antigen/teichoic acid export membrane protein
MPLREFAYRLLSIPYERVFKERMSDEARIFFLGTSYVAVGTLFGALLTFGFNVLAARVLGPGNFGNLSLITALSAILAISMALVLTPTIKYASGVHDDAERARIISTSAIQVVLFTAATTSVLALLAPQLAHVIGVSVDVYAFALAYAVTITFFTLTMSALRILIRMRAYALFNAAQSVILLAAFLTFVGYDVRSWQAAVYSIFVSNVAISLILVVYLKRYFTLQFDRRWSKKILEYAVNALPGAIAISCMGVDRILINRFLTAWDVGIYNAYFLPSLTIALMLWSIVNAGFFPFASKRQDKLNLFRSVNKAAPYLAALLVPSTILLEAIAFIFYGSQYPFSLVISLFFALAAAAFVVYQCYLWLIASVGPSGAKVNAVSAVLALVMLVGLDIVLIPPIGILGAAVALFLAYAVSGVFLFSQRQVLRAS